MEFKFNGFTIDSINYKFINKEESENNNSNLGFGITTEESVYKVTLGMKYIDDRRQDQRILSLEVKITGEFEMNLNEEDEKNIEDKQELVVKNASPILFPYLRALIQFITSFDSSGETIIIPPFNINQLIEKMIEQSEI